MCSKGFDVWAVFLSIDRCLEGLLSLSHKRKHVSIVVIRLTDVKSKAEGYHTLNNNTKFTPPQL